MPFLLVPNEVSSTEAVIWVGVVNETEPADPNTLGFRANGIDLVLPPTWRTFTTRSGTNTIHYQRFNLPNLEPRTEYILELFRAHELVCSGRVRTLPQNLPVLGEQPFTVLLASCFCSRIGGSSSIGNAYLNLRPSDRPDIKILCGDQVYLDDPALHFTFNTHSIEELEDLLFTNYLRTWTQTGFVTGNQNLLQNGANFFSSDDHEFWNNAPNWATLIPDTFSRSGRDAWWKIASSLLRIYQTERSVTRFEIGPVSFFVSDTRVNREPGTGNFMSHGDRDQLESWVNGLSGLGVLVIGQPIFTTKAGFFASRFADKNLPNYEQYEDLARILHKTKRSILVLTGDVHYGRICHVQLATNVFLYEVISSPTALVDARVGGKWEAPPDVFPASGIDGVVKRPIVTNTTYTMSDNHFMTLAFSGQGAQIGVRIKCVPIPENGQPPIPIDIEDLRF